MPARELAVKPRVEDGDATASAARAYSRVEDTPVRPRLAVGLTVLAVALASTHLAPEVAQATVHMSTDRLVLVTLVTSPEDEAAAAMLIDSVRELGGPYAKTPVWVVVDDPERLPCPKLVARAARLLDLEMPVAERGIPYAAKAHAAAQAEALLAGSVDSMVWFDPGTLVLKPPTPLDLGPAGPAVSLRPVSLANKVGLPPEAPIDAFWRDVLAAAGVDPGSVPIVTTVASRERIRAYYNAEIIAFRPDRGICREWARVQTHLITAEGVDRVAWSDRRHLIFLHQAAMTAAILARTRPEERRDLPVECGFPLNAWEGMVAEVKPRQLDDLTCVIIETFLTQHPDWKSLVPVSPRLEAWLDGKLDERLEVTDRILREEGQCNSYLVLTPDGGSVVVDTGGADSPSSRLLAQARRYPVRGVLLTHGHEDHVAGITRFVTGTNVPVVAQREIVDLLAYDDRLHDFLARRTAHHRGLPEPAPGPAPVVTPVPATVLFDDRWSAELGGLRVEMIHTGGETPDTSVVWVPTLKAAFVGDSFYTSFPAIYTLRGTRPRWALDYVKALDTALALEPEVLLPGHGAPVLGRERVRAALTDYRDAVRHVHDATVAGMNAGKDVTTLMREVTLPPGSRVDESYGRVSWSVRGIYDGYAGWFDETPQAMYPEPPGAAYPELLALAGGAEPVVARAAALTAAGQPVKALDLCDVVLATEPAHRGALEARRAALTLLRRQAGNWAEARWLEHFIAATEARLAAAGPEHSSLIRSSSMAQRRSE